MPSRINDATVSCNKFSLVLSPSEDPVLLQCYRCFWYYAMSSRNYVRRAFRGRIYMHLRGIIDSGWHHNAARPDIHRGYCVRPQDPVGPTVASKDRSRFMYTSYGILRHLIQLTIIVVKSYRVQALYIGPKVNQQLNHRCTRWPSCRLL